MSRSDNRRAPDSERTLKWLLAAVSAAALFGLGRWSADFSRLQEVERSQQALRQQVEALGGRSGGAAAAAPAPVPTLKTGIDLAVAGMPALGSAAAPVTLVEFSDFQCPFCGRYVKETLPRIKAEYVETGKIRYVFRHFPIASLHPQAVGAARAAACAQAQDKFWPMHNLLFANPRAQSDVQLAEYARAGGLNMTTYATCVAGPAVALVDKDLDAGARAGIAGTPAFFLGTPQSNGTVRVSGTVYGAKPFEAFQAAIEEALTAARAGGQNPNQ